MSGTAAILRQRPMSGLLILLLLAPSMVAATQFKVGGSSGWRVPPAGAESYNHWAEKNRFQKGDSLLFVYPAGDSVLQVSKDDYGNCSTAHPIKTFSDGNTAFTFNDSGPFYFISGMADNCNKGQKLAVVVLADRSTAQSAASLSTPMKLAAAGAMAAFGLPALFAL